MCQRTTEQNVNDEKELKIGADETDAPHPLYGMKGAVDLGQMASSRSRPRGLLEVLSDGILHGQGLLADDARLVELLEDAADGDSDVSAIDLDRCVLGPRTADILGRALQHNTELSEVTLSDCCNGGRARPLAVWADVFKGVALADASALSHLKLPRNRLGDNEVMALVACLRGDDDDDGLLDNAEYDERWHDIGNAEENDFDYLGNPIYERTKNVQGAGANDDNIHLLRQAKGRLGLPGDALSGPAAVLRIMWPSCSPGNSGRGGRCGL